MKNSIRTVQVEQWSVSERGKEDVPWTSSCTGFQGEVTKGRSWRKKAESSGCEITIITEEVPIRRMPEGHACSVGWGTDVLPPPLSYQLLSEHLMEVPAVRSHGTPYKSYDSTYCTQFELCLGPLPWLFLLPGTLSSGACIANSLTCFRPCLRCFFLSESYCDHPI